MLCRQGALVGEHEYLLVSREPVEPSRRAPVLEAQVDGGEIRPAPWAQEFPATSETSCSRGAREARFSLRHSKPALTISAGLHPCSRRCS